MGWYMVKSGLEDRFHEASDVPRVSQYRLASHLTLAFVLYAAFLRSALEILTPAHSITSDSKKVLSQYRKFRMLAHSAKGLIFITAISGKDLLLFLLQQSYKQNKNKMRFYLYIFVLIGVFILFDEGIINE